MNISILIPTKDRPDFILRLLKYYASSNFKGLIFIGDSSSSDLFETNKLNIKRYKKYLSIEHYHDPEAGMFEMSSYLCSAVKTDYSVIVNDDDVVLTKSLYACVDFLSKNKDYSAAHGKAIQIGMEGGKCKAFSKITMIKRYSLQTIKKDTPLERVGEYFDTLANLNMAVIRAEVNKYAYAKASQLDKYNSSYIFGELVHASIVCIKGKVGQVDEYGLLRQYHDQQFYTQQSLIEWVSGEKWCDSFNFLKSTMCQELVSSSDSTQLVASNEVSAILSRWVSAILVNISTKNSSSNNTNDTLKNTLKKISILRFIVRKLRQILDFSSTKTSLSRFTKKDKLTDDVISYLNIVQKKR